MKNFTYSIIAIVLLLLGSSVAHAQYHITGETMTYPSDTDCVGQEFMVTTNAYDASLSLSVNFGDGSTYPLLYCHDAGTSGYFSFFHQFPMPGTYTVKYVLSLAGVPVDSVVASKSVLSCQYVQLYLYNDINGNCLFDTSTESRVNIPLQFEVTKNGVIIDTIPSLGGIFYQSNGLPGDAYSFRVISLSPGLALTCPASSVIYDTITSHPSDNKTATIGIQCTGLGQIERAVTAYSHAGIISYVAEAYITDKTCAADTMTLTMTHDSHYHYVSASLTPLAITDSTITWSITSPSVFSMQRVTVRMYASTLLPIGEIIHSSFSVTHHPSETDTTNNDVSLIDTVTNSYDPNDKSVSPAGNIAAGTRLTYNIHFENLGNDTAFNVTVRDTLSAKLDPSTLQLGFSSAPVMIELLPYGSRTVVQFNFPNINLLDSAHHDDNHGMVSFSIQSNATLPFGDVITNRAGIFFDYNDVVMTNTTYSTIGTPESVIDLSNAPRFAIRPNPAHGTLIIHTDPAQYSSATITTIAGQVVSTSALQAVETTINTSTLPGGMYLITLTGKSGTTTQRFVKE